MATRVYNEYFDLLKANVVDQNCRLLQEYLRKALVQKIHDITGIPIDVIESKLPVLYAPQPILIENEAQLSEEEKEEIRRLHRMVCALRIINEMIRENQCGSTKACRA